MSYMNNYVMGNCNRCDRVFSVLLNSAIKQRLVIVSNEHIINNQISGLKTPWFIKNKRIPRQS